MVNFGEDSPAVRWIEKSGRADEHKKAVETFQQTAINLVALRYPQLKRLAKAQIRSLKDLERFQKLILDLSMAQSSDEAQNVLLSLDESPDEEEADSTDKISTPSPDEM